MNQNSKKVLITGVLGFIGSHTAKAFKLAGYHVIGIDKEITIAEASSFVDELIIDDFVNIASFVAVENSVDAIIHIAGTSLVGPSILNPGLYYDNNVAKTNIMLDELAKKNWKGKIIFSSSAAVYGNNCVVPIIEDAQGIPVSPYGHSKKMCEYVIRDHSLAHGFKSIALRYFNACGCDKNQQLGNVWNDTHLIPRVIQNLIENKITIINGINFNTKDGTCIRDYLHVTDIANAHVSAVDLCNSFEPGEFRAYNLGTGTGYSNLEIVEAIKAVTKKPLDYKFGPQREGDPNELIADPSNFIKDAKWLPINSGLLQIVETTYNWMLKKSKEIL